MPLPIVLKMKAEGRTSRWLARQLGVHHTMVSHVFLERRPPPARFRAECARIFDMPESELFGPPTDKTPAEVA